jgi:23S rRNA (pseudouridine1915-N3)-methyltransferase
MHKIKVLTIGKTKEAWLDEALDEFYKRLRSQVQFEWVFAKDDEQLIQICAKEPFVIALDPLGRELDSPSFSKYLVDKLEAHGTRLAFVIGGPEGLPEALRKGDMLSFSKFTFTHQIVRLILVEQIYRALEIARGSPYHK